MGTGGAGDVVSVDYGMLARQAAGLCEGGGYWVGALANISALIMESLPDLNWAGFYLRGSLVAPDLGSDTLVLGPFQGRVACTRIAWGKGVCGTAAARDETLVVEDVHAFPGHIACDSASASEVVVPLHAGGAVAGVLDLDSPLSARFTDEDARGLKAVVAAIESAGLFGI